MEETAQVSKYYFLRLLNTWDITMSPSSAGIVANPGIKLASSLGGDVSSSDGVVTRGVLGVDVVSGVVAGGLVSSSPGFYFTIT